ncbi:hypothetical protein GCM10010988_31110 [Cnuibacter physcomitrellae]|uniref:DUF7882 domain-containing protein n=1 Tax=Cnuibacter physcomitrellae TaxID=1619308 RepID=A0A1X9LKA0_9MICO|nr:hypothetical protein [Cnuibacter physcomitrellae]ARJ04351.1 hypothetical protein B5808_03250 [Cnuibacter physcomitrellae]GGI40842.1 hypothetical protein GCM10010988_31110 [Cnuibacter physcomitrellae]
MGFLHIGQNGFAAQIDDRALAHLKVVILSELREGHSLAFTMQHTRDEGSGRDTFWINQSTDLRFQFHGNRSPQLNRAWLKELAATARAGTGLYLTEEPLTRAAVA